MTDTKRDDDTLSDGKAAFALCQEAAAENREAYREDVRFARLGIQWPEWARQQRELDQRPMLTVNKLPSFIRQVVNDARQNKPQITVHPVDDDADPETADIFNGLIRNIEATSNADVAYDTALEAAATGGFGYFTIDTKYASDDTFDLDLCINAVPDPLTIYPDAHDLGADSSEWNTAFETELVTCEEFKRRFGEDVDEVDWDAYGGLSGEWLHDEGKRLLIAKWWSREETMRDIVAVLFPGDTDPQVMDADVFKENAGYFQSQGASVVGERSVRSHKVKMRLLSGADVLEEREWGGKYIPIVPVYGDVVVLEGRRYLRSMVSDARDPQTMFNFWRTAASELVALAPKAPYIGPKGAFKTDREKWEDANVASHAYLEYDGQVAPQRQAFAGVPAGALQEALNANDDLKSIIGIHDPSLGAQGNETSGRMVLARQRKGDVSNFHYTDNLARAIRHGGRILIDLIPPVYSVPRMIRTLGQDGEPDKVRVNAPTQVPVLGNDGKPQMNEQTGEPMMEERVFDLTSGKYDLTVTAGPSFTTQREEQANQMLELVRADPMLAKPLAPLIAHNLDWHGADEVEAALANVGKDQMGAAQAEAQAKMQAAVQTEQLKAQTAMQMAQGKAEVEIHTAQLKADASVAAAQAKAAQETDLARQKAEAEYALKIETMRAENELAQRQMEGEFALKQQEFEANYALKQAETAARIDTNAQVPDYTEFGGEPG